MSKVPAGLHHRANTILKRPTVADMIAVFSQCPLNAPVEIVDADTGWRIVDIHVGVAGALSGDQPFEPLTAPDGTVILWGNYGEMVERGK